MYATYTRWGTFGVGMGLLLAPLVLGYAEVGQTLHEVALGLLACVLALAALETPALRFLNLLPCAWLAWNGQQSADPKARLTEMIAGALLLLFALAPRVRLAPRLPAVERNRAGLQA
ncbi:MAG TPA: hypothetical protein VMU15_04310 [Anaeromyxobacter sp.]|nr:hypothetical protein [Anaeromyxobacter sp.]